MAAKKNISNAPDNIVRIFRLIKKRRKMSDKDWGTAFGISDFRNSSAKWRYIESGLNLLDKVGADTDDLYSICDNCGFRNPHDYDFRNMTDEEIEAFLHPCENCGTPLFSE